MDALVPSRVSHLDCLVLKIPGIQHEDATAVQQPRVLALGRGQVTRAQAAKQLLCVIACPPGTQTTALRWPVLRPWLRARPRPRRRGGIERPSRR
jgi:hypothetical protein